jgi:Domain of unknown function (DUF4062)
VFITIYHSVALLVFAVAVALAWGAVPKLRNTSATYNARLLPFAYYSFGSWIFWALQYVLLTASPFISAQTDFFVSAGLSLAVLQNACWASAVLSLSLQKFSPMWVTAPLVIGVAVAFRPDIIRSAPFALIDAVSAAVIFTALAYSMRQLGQSRIFFGAFFVHAITQWIWRSLWFSPSPNTHYWLLIAFPIWHIALLFAWVSLISSPVEKAKRSHQEAIKDVEQLEMPEPLEVMISSTVADLGYERDAAARAIRGLRLVELRADTIGSLSHSPQKICAMLARRCDIFILIIGERYGYILEPEQISAVEFEYRIARAQNPKKILVYVKNGVVREPRLEAFLEDVADFKQGYLRTLFTTPENLYQQIQGDIAQWLRSQIMR